MERNEENVKEEYMDSNSEDKPILVIGGTGKTGRRIVKRLRDHHIPVRVGSRKENPSFDWEDRTTWESALHGTKSAYISYYPDLAVEHAAKDIAEFSAIAKKNGVNHLVLLSGRGEEGAQNAEDMLIKSGVEWTIIRCSWFCQNFSEGFLLDQINHGEISLPIGDVKEPFIDAEDIADVAFAALTEEGHEGRLYEMTGSSSISFEEATNKIAGAIGKNIKYNHISVEKFEEMLKKDQTPQVYIDFLIELFTQVFDGRNTDLELGVQEALGRKPRSFDDYVRVTAESGIWTI